MGSNGWPPDPGRALGLRDIHDDVEQAWRHATSARALIGDDTFGVTRLDSAISVLSGLMQRLRREGMAAA